MRFELSLPLAAAGVHSFLEKETMSVAIKAISYTKDFKPLSST
jgi:hypothetical protein